MRKMTVLGFLLLSIFSCDQTSKNSPVSQKEEDIEQKNPDLMEITDVINGFYNWYAVFMNDAKRAVQFLDTQGSAAKLDNEKLGFYHAEMMKSGFISKDFIDNDLAFLKGIEVEWKKNNENGSDGPLSGMDYDRIFCGQDWDIEAYTAASIKVEGLGTNQVKAKVEASTIELVKENGKWLITKIICE